MLHCHTSSFLQPHHILISGSFQRCDVEFSNITVSPTYTSSPRPLTATLIKSFPPKRFVLTGFLSSQQLCLPATFKNRSSATGLCCHHTTTQKIHLFEIVISSATCDLWIYSFLTQSACTSYATHTHLCPAESTSSQQNLVMVLFQQSAAAALLPALLLSDINCSRLHF